jgi:hypothetical protein
MNTPEFDIYDHGKELDRGALRGTGCWANRPGGSRNSRIDFSP